VANPPQLRSLTGGSDGAIESETFSTVISETYWRSERDSNSRYGFSFNVCVAPALPTKMPPQMPSRVATRWRFLKSKKPPQRAAFRFMLINQHLILVAGTGFEPVTFRL